MVPENNETYQVTANETFNADWRAGVTDRWIDQMVHPAQLEFFIRSFLAKVPLTGDPMPSIGSNAYSIRFPRSVHGREMIEIIYTVIEDDRTVQMQYVSLILDQY